MTSRVLWSPNPEKMRETSLAKFAQGQGLAISDYEALHRWSVSDLGGFWSALWDFCGVTGDKGPTAFEPDTTAWMTGARFFPDAKLNIAENILRGSDEAIVVHEMGEEGWRLSLTRGDLRSRTARVAEGLRAAGIVPGDRIAGILPNTADALVALLATLSIGAVWTSCSPDFGTQAIVDRIGQVAPRVLFAAPLYYYAKKRHDIADRIAEVLENVPSIEGLVISGQGEVRNDISVRQEEFGHQAFATYADLSFDHPAYILYTSGTTGPPKAIVHRTGGVLLQHLKEHVLHGDVRPGDTVTWYTNTAWMMYHWTVSALAAGAAIVLYDGAPILKSSDRLDPSPLWRMAEETHLTHLGVSPKFMSSVQAEGYTPGAHHDLRCLRALFSCGAPTLPHQFDWVYDSVKNDIMFASISGGTEILGSFLIGSPVHPVRRGQLTVPALGHAVVVLDDRGIPVVGRRGELACTEPFPSMPLAFWGSGGKERYHDTYLSSNREVWIHGDVAEFVSTGGGYVHGRSDNTLKPGGVRIGTSEIYAICESFDEFDDALVFGAVHDGDEEVVLAIKPADGVAITADLLARLRGKIRSDVSPRHVPARIHQVSDIPYTINGKRVEGAARAVVAGQRVKNLASLANPNSLEEFRGLRREDAL